MSKNINDGTGEEVDPKVKCLRLHVFQLTPGEFLIMYNGVILCMKLDKFNLQ